MSNMYYKGTVELQLKIGGKFYTITKHNEGLDWLKYIFAKFLAGEIPTVKPSVMDLLRYEEGDEGGKPKGEGVSYLTSKLPSTGKTYTDAYGYYTEFKAYLSSDNLVDIVSPEEQKASYWLYLQTNFDDMTKSRHDLARIKVENTLLSKITPGTTGTIVWKMRLLNETEVEGAKV